MKVYSFLILSIFSVFIISCSGHGIMPDVKITTPLSGARYFVGSQIAIEASLTNDELIDQYKVEMKLALPCEPLDSTSSGSILFGNHSYLFVSSTHYGQSHISETISIPANFTPGNYHLIVSALNNQFNEGHDTLLISILNPIDTVPAQLSFSSPLESSSWSKGDTLRITGEVNDTRSDLSAGAIHRVKIMLVPQFSGPSSIELYNNTEPNLLFIEKTYFLAATLPAGKYILRIMALDEFNNTTNLNIGITIAD